MPHDIQPDPPRPGAPDNIRDIETVTCEPPILYFGTPVALISSLNPDGSANLAPMSSIFWLGWRCVLGLATGSATTQNLISNGECVINLPSVTQAGAVDRLALTTGTEVVPRNKLARGYRHEGAKFACAGLTPIPSETVAPPRAAECPVQLEAVVEHHRPLAQDDPIVGRRTMVLEARITRVHAARAILMPGQENRVDPMRWRPLMMCFQEFFGLSDTKVHASTLGTVPEKLYRSPDVDRARQT